MSTPMTARHLGGDRFAVEVRGHTILVDQPLESGGEDTAPTPTELFIAALTACIAFYARRYLERHHIPAAGLEVTADYTMGGRPARVSAIDVHIAVPPELPAERRDAFLAVASHCTVHNTLEQPPMVGITIDAPVAA
jgi:putative redox protein